MLEISTLYATYFCISRFHVIASHESHHTLFLINETLIFVKYTLFEKYTRIYGAFAPNSEVCFGQEFSTSNSALYIGYHQNMLFSSQTDTL